jgi:pseudouridylate synthase
MLRQSPEVREALHRGDAVVALESSVLAQGLPIPANREAAERMAAGVRSQGAVPAIIAIIQGTPVVGATGDDLERLLAREGVRKVSARDLAVAMAHGESGATTVAGTLALMGVAGLGVFATGGIGGVHRDAPWDESADLVELARTPAIVVCAGAKSILNLPATLERLETLGVAVIGFRTDEFPAFHAVSSGLPVTATVETVGEILAIESSQRRLGRREALLVVQPPPADVAIPFDELERIVKAALAEGAARGVRGSAVTPWLLAEIGRATGGRTLATNLALLEANARLAGEIATALASATGVAPA